jgi:hypothetical protein
LPWLTIGKAALANWQAIVIAALLAFLWIQGKRIDNLKEAADGFERTIAAHVQAAKHNAAQFQHCKEINASNEREAERQREAAEQAAQRARMLRAELDTRIDAIPDEAEEFNDEECRTLDDPLPADFVEWLRDP